MGDSDDIYGVGSAGIKLDAGVLGCGSVGGIGFVIGGGGALILMLDGHVLLFDGNILTI